MNEKQFKALSVEQRKAIQRSLQGAGHYTGDIDGEWGGGTKSALELADKAEASNAATAAAKEEKARADRLREIELETARETARANAELALARQRKEGEGQDVQNATATAKALRRQKFNEDADSALGMAAQSGASVAAPALAGWAGLRFGDKVNQAMDRGQEKRNVTLQGAAADRVKGLTTREGAITGAKLAGAMPPTSPLARVLGRLGPHAGLAALSGTKGASLLGNVDEEQPFYPRMADRGAGLAYLGFGGGILKRGIQQAQSPGVSPDAQALSVINSSQLRRNNQAPEDTAPKLTPKQALLAEAKAAGITGTSKLNMTQLRTALQKVGQKTPLIGPALAGALAYGATPDDANAADGGPIAGRTSALTNAGVASGTAAGTGYGLSKLAKALGNAGRGALGAAGAMASPMMAADAYDPTREELNRDRHDVAQMLPSWARVGALEDAYQMAQVPERAPEKRDEYASARSLRIPEGIPLPRPDGSQPEPDLAALEQAASQDPELAEMLKELIMARVGEAQQHGPVPNAMASMQAARQQPSAVSAALRNIAQR